MQSSVGIGRSSGELIEKREALFPYLALCFNNPAWGRLHIFFHYFVIMNSLSET